MKYYRNPNPPTCKKIKFFDGTYDWPLGRLDDLRSKPTADRMATRNTSFGWQAKVEVREFKSRAEMLEFVEDANIKIGKKQSWGYDESVHWKPLLREPKPSDIGYRTGNPASNGQSRFTDEKGAWGLTPNNLDADYIGVYVRMTREKFLRLAAPLPEAKKNSAVAAHMAAGGKVATPILYVKIPSEWQKGDFSRPAEVTGHEGRNRMTAIPPGTVENVLIIPRSIPEMRARHITPQILGEIHRRLYTENDDLNALKHMEFNNFALNDGRTGNPRSYPNLIPASPRDFESMSPSGEITTEPGYHKGLYYGDAGCVTYNVSKGRNGEWVAHLDSMYDESPWALAGLAPYHFKTMRLEDVSDRLSRISAACATLERGSRAHAISSPASRFVLFDAGPNGANDRYTLIDTQPYNEDMPSFREPKFGDFYLYLGFGPGVSAHGEMTARDFNALKAERFRSLGKRIKIESLPENLRRLAEQFIEECAE